jgi:hypothetical protein
MSPLKENTMIFFFAMYSWYIDIPEEGSGSGCGGPSPTGTAWWTALGASTWLTAPRTLRRYRSFFGRVTMAGCEIDQLSSWDSAADIQLLPNRLSGHDINLCPRGTSWLSEGAPFRLVTCHAGCWLTAEVINIWCTARLACIGVHTISYPTSTAT